MKTGEMEVRIAGRMADTMTAMDGVVKVAREHGYKVIAKGMDCEPGVLNAIFVRKPTQVVQEPEVKKAAMKIAKAFKAKAK